jgi:thiol-disulfide isomerase/thioredoxin
MKRFATQAFFVLVIIGIAGAWQSRHMPQGSAPTTFITGLDDESSLSIPTLKGNVEFIYFFAPWCQVCKLSAPNAATVSRWFPDISVHYVGMDFQSPEEVREFAAKHIQGTVYLGNDSMRENWSINAYPAYAIVNSQGKISFNSVGYSTTLGMALRVFAARIGF